MRYFLTTRLLALLCVLSVATGLACAMAAGTSTVNLQLSKTTLWANMNCGATETAEQGSTISVSEVATKLKEWGDAWALPSADQLRDISNNACWVWTTDFNPGGVSTYSCGFIAFKPGVDGDKGKVLKTLSGSSYTYSLSSDLYVFFPVDGSTNKACYAGSGAYLQLAGGSSPSVSVTSAASGSVYLRPVVDNSKMGVDYKAAIKITAGTSVLNTGNVYEVSEDVKITSPGINQCAMRVEGNGVVVISFKNGKKLDLSAQANSLCPALYLRKGQTLLLVGSGELIAQGGNGTLRATSGENGHNAGDERIGQGGSGGRGGDGAAPGIGNIAGVGGAGGAGGEWGNVGSNGTAGADAGNMIIAGNVKVTSLSGQQQTANPQYQAQAGHAYYAYHTASSCYYTTGGGGGGNGGVGGTPKYSLCGGSGGGGGGGGSGVRGLLNKRYYHNDQKSDNNDVRRARERGERQEGYGGYAGESHIQPQENQNGLARVTADIGGKTDGARLDNADPRNWFRNAGGKKGANGADGKVYVMTKLASLGDQTTCDRTDWAEADFRSNLTSAMSANTSSDRSKMLGYIIHGITVDANTTNGSTILFNAYGKQYTGQFECFNGMEAPTTFTVSTPTVSDSNHAFDGFYITWNGVTFKAFDANGVVTDDFWNYCTKTYNGTRVFDIYDNLVMQARYTMQTSLTVYHCVLRPGDKDTSAANFKKNIVYSDTEIRIVSEGQNADYYLQPYQTMGGKTIMTNDNLLLSDALYQVHSSSPIKARLKRTVQGGHAEYDYIYYTPRESSYTLETSALDTYGASYAGEAGTDYTSYNQVQMGDMITLPRVEFKKAGTDGKHYMLYGWLTSNGDTLAATVQTLTMPLGTLKVEPLFTESALMVLTAMKGEEFGRPDRKQTVSTANTSVLLYTDGSTTKHTAMLIAGSDKTSRIYVYVKHPTGIVVKDIKAEMTSVANGQAVRSVTVYNAALADSLGKCYIEVPADWTKGFDEEVPMLYITAVFDVKRGTITPTTNVKASKVNSLMADVPANTVATAVTVDNKNFYTDDDYFKTLIPKYGVQVAGTLAQFEYYADEVVYIYNKVQNSSDQTSVKLTLTPAANSGVTAKDLWATQYKYTEIFTADGTRDTVTYNAFHAADGVEVEMSAALETSAANVSLENYQPDVQLTKVYADDYDITGKMTAENRLVTYNGVQGTAYGIPAYDDQMMVIRVEGDSLPETSLMTVSYTYEGEAVTDTLTYIDGGAFKYWDGVTGKEIQIGERIAGYWIALSKDVPMTVRIIRNDNPTAIEGVKAEATDPEEGTADKPRYTIGGQRIKGNYKGIVIMGGKKVIVK